MDLIVIGLNHRTAPVEIREKAYFSQQEVLDALTTIQRDSFFKEALILSTCNRTEFYTWGITEKARAEEYTRNFIKKFKRISTPISNDYFYSLDKEACIKHLFEVASGLDSMIFGENQILGQVKNAYSLCCEAGSNGVILNKLFHWAFRVGKRARTETEIGMGAVSVSSAAVELAQKIFRDLSKHSALLIGAGQTGELAAKHLKEKNIKFLYITNRTYERAALLAEKLACESAGFEKIDEILKKVDIVISSTSSRDYLFKQEQMKKIMGLRNHRPLFIIDISVPRDFEPAINKIYNVFLHSIDDLNTIVDKNLEKRKNEIPKVINIIEEETRNFLQWYRTLKITPVIKSLQKKMEDIRVSELKKSRKFFREEDWVNLDLFTKSLVKKLIRLPLLKIKELSEESKMALQRLDTVKEIFNLEDNMENGND